MIRLLSLNANRNSPCRRQIVLLKRVNPDVICLQEAREDAMETLDELGFHGAFAPQWQEIIDGKATRIGSALLTKSRCVALQSTYFRGDPQGIPAFNGGCVPQEMIPRAVQCLDLPWSGGYLSVANVHFTWSKGGTASDLQRSDLQELIRLLAKRKTLVLCGDFNAPHDGEILNSLRSHVEMAGPKSIRSTIDGRYHYAKGLEISVDAVLCRGNVKLSPVLTHFAVSDHCALSTVVSLPGE